MKNNRDYCETYPMAVALALCVGFVTAYARFRSYSSAELASQVQQREPAAPAKIQLNNQDMGTSNDTSVLSKKLEEIFKTRKEQHAYRIGMERRSDLTLDERIEKGVFVKAERSIQLEEVAKVIDAVEHAGASPVLLPIYIEGQTKNCATCPVRDRIRNRTILKPNPLILLVQLGQPNSSIQRDAYGLPSMNDFLASDGIPIVLSSSAGSGSVAVITITKDGEYALGEKRIQKADLEKEIRDRVKVQPGSEKVIAIKWSPHITHGSLEDVYRAAYAAGVTRIDLEKVVDWEDQKAVSVPIADLTLALPTELDEESPLSEPHQNGDVTWTHYSYAWGGRHFPLEVNVTITAWDKGFPPEAGGMSPEAILEQDYAATEREKQTGEVEELRYLELDGVKGVFFVAAYAAAPGNKNTIMLGWSTYRHHKNKAEKLSITVIGNRSDLKELTRIINSVRLTQK